MDRNISEINLIGYIIPFPFFLSRLNTVKTHIRTRAIYSHDFQKVYQANYNVQITFTLTQIICFWMIGATTRGINIVNINWTPAFKEFHHYRESPGTFLVQFNWKIAANYSLSTSVWAYHHKQIHVFRCKITRAHPSKPSKWRWSLNSTKKAYTENVIAASYHYPC